MSPRSTTRAGGDGIPNLSKLSLPARPHDMYARFFRWASDRIKDEGIIAFVSNRSFIDSRTFDGFRKIVARDFKEILVVDLGGDVRANPKLSGTKHNVFGRRASRPGARLSFPATRIGAGPVDLAATAANLRWRKLPRLSPNASHRWKARTPSIEVAFGHTVRSQGFERDYPGLDFCPLIKVASTGRRRYNLILRSFHCGIQWK
jgi:hypothetical protein